MIPPASMEMESEGSSRQQVSRAWRRPAYAYRRAAAAQDPLAVVEAFKVEVLRLAQVLGIRMCPRCPQCNVNGLGCQDKFGSNMRPMGGVLGGMAAFGGGIEHQGCGTPHLHAEGHIVCAYQFGTLEEVATKILEGLMSAGEVKDYQSWLCCEDIVDKPATTRSGHAWWTNGATASPKRNTR